ncbi:hypothetical protein KFL_000850260 [Klebsormidium nitens]|uniref:Thioredoxin domain-containing protein n=1 Tax=Klebsormidium nitens TaxID=105231 RepID=A0A1Y1HSK2_KLENI|nr:hypothetical protein KFL_000850260 [Klebsormidium nitens]|eukprot:GAQ81610.1 hypothetical protein KFL_000850260 [Klebsormidium nitens]
MRQLQPQATFQNGVRPQEAHRRREHCVSTSQHCHSNSRRLCISGYTSPPLPICLDCTRPPAWPGQRAAIGPKTRLRSSGGLESLTSPRIGHQRSGQKPIRRCTVITGAAKKTFRTFEELIEGSEQPVLVDWYADFCGPCHMMTPVLNEVGTQLKPHLKVVKIDTQKYPVLASKYGIRALPTLVLFKDGKVIDRVEGALNADQLLQRLRYVLKLV